MPLADRLGRSLFSALPDLAVGAVCLTAWLNPAALSAEATGGLATLMALELPTVMVVVTLGQALTSPAMTTTQRVLGTVALVSVLSYFVGALAPDWWRMLAFWLMIVNRLSPALLAPIETTRKYETISAIGGFAAILFIACIVVTYLILVAGPSVFPAALQSRIYQGPKRLIFGALYFTIWGVAELLDQIPDRPYSAWRPGRGKTSGAPFRKSSRT